MAEREIIASDDKLPVCRSSRSRTSIPEFLESEEGRPVRILSEYLDPLKRFKDQKIQDTVVFFGSARVDSRERAERALKTLRARGVRDADEHYERRAEKKP